MTRTIAVLLVLSALLAGCSPAEAPKASTSSRAVTVISIWHPWGGTQKERFDQVVNEFNKSHPDIQVRPLFTPNDLSNNQKFFTAVAANKPPDAVFVDGQQTAAWAEQGSIEPLDSRLAKDKISRADYFPPCWDQNVYKGHFWALTYCADPNFAFVWNKKAFREVGLDPEKPPTTIEELDEYNTRLTKRVGGKIVRMGIIPWSQFGGANSLFTWGWAFGGDFYDAKTNRVTATDPRVVKSLEWMVSYAKRFDVTKVNAFASGFGSREQNPLYIGQVAMAFQHISGVEEIKQYAPTLDYGISYIPAPLDGEAHSSWVGGWCMAIPKGSKHPDKAWEFIKWCCRAEGTEFAGKLQGLLPGYRKSPYFETIRNKPGYGEYLRILEECRHQRPVMPAQAFYMNSLTRAVDFAIYGQMSPKDALKQSNDETQAELDLRLAGR